MNRKAILFVLLALLATFAFAWGVSAQEATEAATEGGTHATEAAVTAEGEAAVEEATNPLTPLGINAGFLLAQIVNFLLLFTLLTVVMWRPLVNMLDSRGAKIQKGLEDAAAAANARRNAETDAAKIIDDAKRQAANLVEEARVRGDEVAKQAAATAQTDAEQVRAEARERAEEEMHRRLADLRGQVAAISVAMAERLIGTGLDEKRQQALVSDFFAKVPQGALSMSGNVEVVSAMPLTDAEKSKVKKEVGASDVSYSVDPNILGGLIVRSEDKVVDGSVRNSLGDLASRLR
ncbi:MAG: F0F1 ATP synthase subunit B [Anaerolineae bacterium]|nr:F0F1 ATP synthase subunit B [Anaerolineae bacterium]